MASWIGPQVTNSCPSWTLILNTTKSRCIPEMQRRQPKSPLLMNKVFKDLIGGILEVYVDDMLVKTKAEEDLIPNLEKVFS
ncbi:hypothetical protein PIB30_086178 [Stylosanthes scabra]|uniref:Reverse transcriptase domain-containing protein n=1 Tax=Stylosanthes scabra TaxID=79078 RepID=A0ABU6YVT5_9FABA|nr:hypothetical protein [Stylosanthes scabra]